MAYFFVISSHLGSFFSFSRLIIHPSHEVYHPGQDPKNAPKIPFSGQDLRRLKGEDGSIETSVIILTMGNSSQNFPVGEWRVILSDPMPGPMNMALDHAILSAVERNEVQTTLRLYSWTPPCLSLGYSQPYSDIDLSRIKSNGWDIVRRPTGGRAILHTDELTYAVIGSKADPILEGSLMQSYSRISQALREGLTNLGLSVQVHQGKAPSSQDQAVCFEIPSDYEITVGGKKIIGSAQARKKEGILQHGSLPLGGDLARITECLQYETPTLREQAGAILLEKAATVESILGQRVSWQKAADAFLSGFEKALDLQLKTGDITTTEKKEMEKLVKEKYNNPAWTQHTSPNNTTIKHK